MRDLSLFSAVASCSSGVELDRAQIVVVGNARGHGGAYRIGHSVMRDALDQDGIWNAICDAGLDLPERPHPSDLGDRLVNVFLKCEADPTGYVRGRRNAMLDDSDVFWHRQIKATVGGVAASVTGDPAVFVSVAAVHQGPSGGGPVAAIAAGLSLVDSPHVAVLATDLPFLTASVLGSLLAAVGDDDVAVLVDDDGRDQLLVAAWRTERLRRRLAALGEPADQPVRRLFDGASIARVDVHRRAADPAPWLDCDTEDDLRRAREWT